MTNLSEREQLDQTVRHNPDLLAGIIESAMDAIIAIDDDQKIMLFNAAAQKMFRCRADEAIGSPVELFIPQRFRAEHSTHVRRFGTGGVTNRAMGTLGTLWGLRTTGEEFPIEASISRVESGGNKFFTVVIRDITDRHRAEEALQESEKRFRLVADTAPALMWMSGTDKLCNYFNKPWLDFTGRSMDAELGNGWAEGVHPDDLQRCLQTYTQSFDRREKFRMQYRLRRYDGEYRWILDIGVPRFNQDRSFAGYIGIAVDVTERKEADEALRESEQRFRLAAQAGRMYAYTWDVPTDVIVRSGNASGVLGSTGETPITRQQTRARVHPDDRAIFDTSLSQHTVEHPDVQISYRMLRPDGSVVWVEKTAHAMFDEQGRMVRAVGMVADITERKRAEEALRESEEKFRGVFRTAGAGMVIVSPERRFLAANKAFCDCLGYTEEELLAKTVESITLPEDWPAFSEKLSEALTEGRSIQWAQKRCLHKSGRVVHTESSASVIRSREGHPQYVVAQVLDITKRKEAEEALRESEQRFRLVADAAPVMIWMSGLNKNPTYFNKLWMDFTGLSETDLQNGLVGIVHPDDYLQCREVFFRAFDQRQPFKKESRLRRHDGQYRWMLALGVPWFHNDGSFAGYIGSCIDVTDHKLAEESLAEMSRKLVEAQEQERARIARELHDDVSQRLALLAIELEQLLDNSSEVGSRVQELRKEVRAISKDVQALSHDLHSSQLEYLGVVAGMKSWCKEFGERQGMQIDYRHDLRSTVPAEIGLSLFRVLQEALHNATKHSGVKRTEVQLHEESDEIHLIIRDLGKGFDMEAAKRGKGLGLTSMQERVRLVNGTISIYSKPMGGTTIHVRVPFASEKVSQREAV